MILIYNILEKKYIEKKLDYIDMEKILKNVNNTLNLSELFDKIYMYCDIICKKIYNSKSTSLANRIYTFMEKNYDSDLKLDRIAKVFNYNKTYLGKVIRKQLGDSFNNLLDKIRINKAKEMLRQTNLKVYQISEKVGYGTLDYFYVKFKKYVGMSPTKYRLQNKKDI